MRPSDIHATIGLYAFVARCLPRLPKSGLGLLTDGPNGAGRREAGAESSV